MNARSVAKLNGCSFCQIIRGKERAVVVYDDEEHICIMDRHPFNPGHILAIPKKHYSTIFDMPSSEVGKLFTLVADLAKILVRVMRADGLNIGQNNGAAANQLIFHVHVHLIPRYSQDAAQGRFPARKKMSFEELETTAKLIRQEMAKGYK